jgi:hypothetical protein
MGRAVNVLPIGGEVRPNEQLKALQEAVIPDATLQGMP